MWWWSYSDKNRVKHVLLCYIYHLSAARRGDVLRLVSAPNFARFKSLDGFQRWSTEKISFDKKGPGNNICWHSTGLQKLKLQNPKPVVKRGHVSRPGVWIKNLSNHHLKKTTKKHTVSQPIFTNPCVIFKVVFVAQRWDNILEIPGCWAMDPSSLTCLNMSTWSVEATRSGVDTGIAYVYFSHTHTYNLYSIYTGIYEYKRKNQCLLVHELTCPYCCFNIIIL